MVHAVGVVLTTFQLDFHLFHSTSHVGGPSHRRSRHLVGATGRSTTSVGSRDITEQTSICNDICGSQDVMLIFESFVEYQSTSSSHKYAVCLSVLCLLLLIYIYARGEFPESWCLPGVGALGVSQTSWLAARELTPEMRNMPLKHGEQMKGRKVVNSIMAFHATYESRASQGRKPSRQSPTR